MKQEGTKFQMEGIVVEKLRGSTFKVRLNDNDAVILCTLSGKLRMNKIYISLGDKVVIDIDISDVSKGRIIYRY